MKRSGPYLVEWYDSRGVTDSWIPFNEIVQRETVFCLSVGFIAFEDEHKVVLVPHIADAEETDKLACGEMTIPKGAIQAMKPLEIQEDR